jgi:hypothetical protein
MQMNSNELILNILYDEIISAKVLHSMFFLNDPNHQNARYVKSHLYEKQKRDHPALGSNSLLPFKAVILLDLS